MRITTILGSPKMNGKTVAALELTEKKLRLLKHNITRFNLNEYEINGCCGCYSCMQSKETPDCIINDDMDNILSKLISADAVILSSPIHFGTYVIPHSNSDYFSERAELITSELVKILVANFHSQLTCK